MYKDPILKSKKKEPIEIDVTDLNKEARGKIVRASEIPILIEEKSRSTVLPDETIEHAAENAQPDISDLICVCDPIQFRYVGNLFPPCVGANLLRGRYGTYNVYDGDQFMNVDTGGYISKEILWIDEDGIWTERFTNMPQSGTLEVIRNNGSHRQLINVTAKRDFEVKVNQYGVTVIKWEDEQDFHETTMWTGSFVKGSCFTTTNNVGALPGERVILYNDITIPEGYENPRLIPYKMIDWYAYTAVGGASNDDYTIEYMVVPYTERSFVDNLITNYDRDLQLLDLRVMPKIYQGDEYTIQAKFNALRYSWDDTLKKVNISADTDMKDALIELWFRSVNPNV